MINSLNKKAWGLIFMEEYEESIRSLRKSLDLQPVQSKPKFRLVIAIVF